ncbi:hypothetical protein JJD41_10425 [Oxynema sp. CENA135]|jgi:hypothetical protein|uniref:Uncharacterized protein n=1 Tax=Oxynema aestuarii AP17 TaxID=2064643 RepID=A0A6H1U1A9_9CYAN|nr:MULTISPECIES: hypothetical protein [Oxynema]MBK4730274.1 hypothetical protein [Oxynema sp. CENA135]QIZ72167.1 hypothetical protein HCG48_17635 [Oxynema aestuarii AP17]
MSQIFPVIVLAIATIAIAYFLELFGVIFSGFSFLFTGMPDWTWTAVLLVLVIATYRALPE